MKEDNSKDNVQTSDEDTSVDDNVQTSVTDENSCQEGVVEDVESEETDELAFKEARIKELEENVEEHKASYLRKHADFENFRKRMIKEKSDSIKYANESLITDLIEVVDNFDRALSSANENVDFKSFKEGVELIEKQFKGMLSSNWGLSKIESVGTEFDPQIHEAMFMEDSDEVENPTVVEEFQSGYMLHGKVLRASKVKVQKPVEAE